MTVDPILDKAVAGERLSFAEGVALFDCNNLAALGRAADAVTRRLHPEPYRTFNIDRNVNYTNVCAAVCDFCAFYRKSGDADAYVLPREELYRKIDETLALGGRSTATMMFGHVETVAERIEHLERLRSLQDETGGFTAFICWTFQPGHKMADHPAAGSFEYLKTQAIARLYLDNIPNIQSSWVTQGQKVGQLALLFGANDMGSLMIEENVVASAGTVYHLTLDEIKRAIRELGYVPRQRNVFYQLIAETPLTHLSDEHPVVRKQVL